MKWTISASPIIANILLNANCFPICENPRIRNGKLIPTISTESNIPVVSEINREIPIAPPSMNELGSRNPFNPKPAETIPMMIKKVSFIKWDTLILNISFLVTLFVIRINVTLVHTQYKEFLLFDVI